MTIDDTQKVDFVTIDRASGDTWLTIADHLPWDQSEDHHILLLQDKLSVYLAFIESGQLVAKFPETKGRGVVINLVGKFPLSARAEQFIKSASDVVQHAGFRLQFKFSPPANK